MGSNFLDLRSSLISTPSPVSNPSPGIGTDVRFMDASKGILVRTIVETGAQLSALDAKEEKTAEDLENIKVLTGVFDETSSRIIDNIGNKTDDIEVTGDDAKALEIIRMQKEGFSNKIKLTKTNRKVKTITGSSKKKPIAKGLLARF